MPLDEDALIRILTEPKNALVKQYQKLLRDGRRRAGVHAGRAGGDRARQAMKHKTGARGLRTVLEEMLLDVMYDIPSRRESGSASSTPT